MNKNTLIIVVIAVIIMGGGSFALTRESKTQTPVLLEPSPILVATTSTVVATSSEQQVVMPKPKPKPVTTTVIVTPPPPQPTIKTYTAAEVSMHAGESSCWSIVNNKVYDLTSFIGDHPGGDRNIIKICGKDGTSAFNSQHEGDKKPNATLGGFYLGELSS